MSHETQVILDRVVLIKVDANIYGARKKLKKEDLMLASGSKLPPEDLASLGSKRLLDPDKLSVFNRLKKEAERMYPGVVPGTSDAPAKPVAAKSTRGRPKKAVAENAVE